MSASRARRIGAGLAVPAVLAGLLIASGLPLPGLSPQRADAATKKASSWKVAHTATFSSSSLPAGCGAYSGKYSGGASAWTATEVTVSRGTLRLGLAKRTTSGQPYSSGGLGCWDWAQKYGRYEVRAKVPVGEGIDSYLTLVPTANVTGASTTVELLAPPGQGTAYLTNGDGSASDQARAGGAYASAFHTYVIEWAPHHLRITVDGKQVYFSARSYTGSRWFGLAVSTGDALTGLPDAATALPAQFQIDTVRVSSYTGVPPPAPATPATPSPSPAAATAPAGTATPAATSASATPAVGTAESLTALEPVSTRPQGPSLPGGVWPWLLGGSLIAAAGTGGLTYARPRRARRSGRARRSD